jgi:hypothetical protein
MRQETETKERGGRERIKQETGDRRQETGDIRQKGVREAMRKCLH